MPVQLPYIVLTDIWELEAYIEVKLGLELNFDKLTEQDINKLLFKIELVNNEENYKYSKLAFLNSIAPNKLISGTPKKPKATGTFSPDELISILSGYNPKQKTLSKEINNYMKSIGAKDD